MWKQVFIPTVILCASTVVAVLGGNDGCPAIYPIELQLGKNTEIWRSAVDGVSARRCLYGYYRLH
jgi:hypothetical protein